MSSSFLKLSRAAQRAAFAHMGDEGGHRHPGPANRAKHGLGSGARHRLLASKEAASPVEVHGGTPQQRHVVGRLMKDVTKDFPPELASGVKVRLMSGPSAHYTGWTKEIRISSRAVDDHLEGKWRNHTQRIEDVGLHTKSGIKESLHRLLTHEFGHYLDDRIAPGPKKDKIYDDVGAALGFSARLPGESTPSWFARNKDKTELNAGSYAASNLDELAAELWTEYAGRRDNARPAARVFGQHVLKQLGK